MSRRQAEDPEVISLATCMLKKAILDGPSSDDNVEDDSSDQLVLTRI